MKLIEGRYYETVGGITVGPMVDIGSEGDSYFHSQGKEIKQLNIGGGELSSTSFQKWEDDGSVYAACFAEAGHVIIKQVPAPGFNLEVGATYETADGETVGPLEAWGNHHWCFLFYKDGKFMYYTNSGYSCPGSAHLHKDGQDLIHKVSDAPFEVKDGSLKLLKITLDTKEAQKLIDEAAKVFDDAAGNLLNQIADKDEELRAAKEAFNILYREKLGLSDGMAKQIRIIERKNLELDNYQSELSHAEDVIAEKTDRIQRSFKLIESANARYARNAGVHKKNEALGLEVLRLSERIHEIRGFADRTYRDKQRGDKRLNKARFRLKLANERAKDAEDQLQSFTSGKKLVRNGLVLLGIVFTAFGAGGFFF